MDALRDDLRYALRTLAKSPGFAAAAALTFALGIGANATMFGVVDRLLLRPPAHVREPDRVVEFAANWRHEGEASRQNSFSYPAFKAIRDHAQGVEHVAVVSHPVDVPYGRGEHARTLKGLLVSAGYFRALGTRPALGRFIRPEEDVEPVGAPVAVISHGVWRREFGGETSVLGRSLPLGRNRYTVVGVAPKGFTGTGLSAVDVWLPVTAAEGLRFAGDKWATDRNSTWLRVVARLRPGVSPSEAATQALAPFMTAAQSWMATARFRLVADPVSARQAADQGADGRVVTLLTAVSGFVLLIACANVANLLLVRAVRRRREIAVRLALGVSRARLASQLLTESVLLAFVGGGAALVVAYWGGHLVRAFVFEDVTWADAPVDARLLAFTALAAIAAGLLTGLVPALQASNPDLASTLKAGSRGSGGPRSRTRVTLLVAQAAMSVVLLVGTGLFVRSLRNVGALRLGLEPDRVLFARMGLRPAGASPAEADFLFRLMESRVRALPGVQSTAVSVTVPFWSSYGTQVRVPGRDSLPRPPGGGPYYNAVTPGFFETMGTRIVRGRGFTDEDRATGPRVTVINETMARLWWPGTDPVGRCIRIGSDTAPCTEIIGVAENAKRQDILEGEVLFFYYPLAQSPKSLTARVLVARPSGGDASRMIEPIRRAMQTVAPNLPHAEVRLLATLFASEVRPWRLGAAMFGAFGALALLLAVVGLYSVVSYSVAQRTHEMGVRVALGAQPSHITRLVLGEGLGVIVGGAGLGGGGAVAAGQLVEPLLFRVSPRDPSVFAGVLATILAVATAASLAPARRAVRVDPAVALRTE